MSDSYSPSAVPLADVLEKEKKHVLGRRKDQDGSTLFGVALSGGGVRSATVSLGFLQSLLEKGVLGLSDYLSSVSGGGYASGYLLSGARVFEEPKDMFEHFPREQLIKSGRYLAMGTGWKFVFRVARLLGSVLSMAVVNFSWIMLLLGALAIPVLHFSHRVAGAHQWLHWHLPFALVVPAARLLGLGTLSALARLAAARSSLGSFFRTSATVLSKLLNFFEGAALLAIGVSVLAIGLAPAAYSAFEWLYDFLRSLDVVKATVSPTTLTYIDQLSGTARAVVALIAGLVVGFFASSDVIGVNVVFRDLIDHAYLRPKKRPHDLPPVFRQPVPLKDAAAPGLPYPLFGGGLYLRGERVVPTPFKSAAPRDPRRPPPPRLVVGTRVMDYFLLSPLFCGAETSLYASTQKQPYVGTTLADAVAVSAASISPLWDGHQNPFFRLLLFVLNLNLGVWVPNPKLIGGLNNLLFAFRLWPLTYLQLLSGQLTTRRALLHVADGGFIDNLGLVELLRRNCGVIIAIDNTFDPEYDFKYLRNAIARAKIELAASIEFQSAVEDELRPSPITGRARKDHLVARINYRDGSLGYMVYVKACLKEPLSVLEAGSQEAAAYPIYNPHFPQETTADQFFDRDQWNAYNGLGRRLAESALKTALGDSPVSRSGLYERLAQVWSQQSAAANRDPVEPESFPPPSPSTPPAPAPPPH